MSLFSFFGFGLEFMGKDWDKAVPSVEIWRECLRVLKSGAFAFIMSIPRQNCLARMIVNLQDAGFNTNFTSLYHCFASGFPKSMNIGKAIDRKLGLERRKVGKENPYYDGGKRVKTPIVSNKNTYGEYNEQILDHGLRDVTIPNSPKAKALDGSYAGFQPKPAVEVIIVAMKPLSEDSYVDQALDNEKGVTWLDDCRIPFLNNEDIDTIGWKESIGKISPKNRYSTHGFSTTKDFESIIYNPKQGRFPANLLVEDDVLNNGKITKGDKRKYKIGRSNQNQTNTVLNGGWKQENTKGANYNDSGSFSRYFSLDAWWEKKIKELPKEVQKTFPFLIVPKASKSERNKGLNNSFIFIETYLTNETKCKEQSITQEEQLARLQMDMDQFQLKDIEESGINNKNVIAWNTMLFGKNLLEKYQKDFAFITKMETNLTTIQKISNWLMLLFTKEYTTEAKKLTINGGNPVVNVVNSNRLIISINEKVAYLLGVKNVASEMRLIINVKEEKQTNSHVTVKPIKLLSYLIILGSRKKDTILDPFIGSGTTMLSSKLLNRNCIGIEINEEYCNIAKSRCFTNTLDDSSYEFEIFK